MSAPQAVKALKSQFEFELFSKNVCQFRGCFWTRQSIQSSLPFAMPGEGQSTAPSVKSCAMQSFFKFPKLYFPHTDYFFKVCKMPGIHFVLKSGEILHVHFSYLLRTGPHEELSKELGGSTRPTRSLEAKRVHVEELKNSMSCDHSDQIFHISL